MKNKLLKTIYMLSKYFLYGFILQLMLFNFGFAIDANGQYKSIEEVTISISNEELSLSQFFREIQRQTPFKFSFDHKEVDRTVVLTFEEKTGTVEKFLIAAAKQSKLSFRQINNNIDVVKDKRTEVVAGQVYDPIFITGIVTDEKREPIPGATVIVEGTSTGTATDIDGNFSLEVDEGAVLVVSFIGYKPQRITTSNQTVLNITMELDDSALEEVVVIGYGTAKKKDLTGAIASVDLEQQRLQPNLNVVQSLRGTVAGVTVTDNGRPGSDASIMIRGRNSISASNAPLIVLDGVIYAGGRLSDINPGDIESIDILKDASSTAVYGSLAANGVIEITTKRGKTDKPRISLNSYYGTSDFAHIPDYLDAEQYLRVRADAERADGGELPFQAIEQANIDAGITIDPFEEIKRRAPVSNNELSVSGKTDRVTYFFSGSYSDIKSPVKGDNFSRIAGRANIDVAVTDWLNVGLNTGYSARDNSGVRADLVHTTYLSPYANLYYEDGTPRPQPMGIGLVSNPLQGTLLHQNHIKSKTLFVNSYADVLLPIEGLSYRLNVGYTQRNDEDFFYRPSFQREQFFNLGNGHKEHYEAQNLTLENIVRYSQVINMDHEINFTFLYGMYTLMDQGSRLSSNNIFNDALGWNSLEIGENFNINTYAGESQQLSTMGRIGYRFKGKYIADFSMRRDGYSAFGQGNKFGIFPAVGLSWNIIEENFLSNAGFLDNLKIRASWGKNGNRGVNRYSSLSNMDRANYVFGDGGSTSVGLYTTTMANPNLGWETTTSTNFGVDFSVLSNRISGSVEYYYSRTTDLLLNQTIPNPTGFETFLRNIGEVENRGVELSLNTLNLQKGAFTWSTSFAFTLNRNKILRLTGRDLNGDGIEDDDIASGWFIGHPLGTNFDYVFDGIFQEGDEDLSLIQGAQPGHVRFKDMDGDGVITPNDRTVLHSNQPDFLAGITNNFSYKGLNLMVMFNVRQGGYSPNVPTNPGIQFYDLANVLNVPYWTPENPINTHAAINYRNPLGYGFYQSRSFVRLQDVSLSYNLPFLILEKLKLGNVQVYVSGKNLVTWTKWQGWDPEFGGGGRGAGNNGPLLKTYTVGLNIQL
ncbi:SusC/RagA family TonB-linked outer membrane protein [Negadavirga shengliensis]|uniref:SusC/RagA family TonB-linked outer membrane protein n=1 Tax=Negadavirga shengliensis TaxID=1389218 RepID=A0ABV9SZ13_9BACT